MCCDPSRRAEWTLLGVLWRPDRVFEVGPASAHVATLIVCQQGGEQNVVRLETQHESWQYTEPFWVNVVDIPIRNVVQSAQKEVERQRAKQ